MRDNLSTQWLLDLPELCTMNKMDVADQPPSPTVISNTTLALQSLGAPQEDVTSLVFGISAAKVMWSERWNLSASQHSG